MSHSSNVYEKCGRLARVIIVVSGACVLVCSVFAAYSCEFFEYSIQDDQSPNGLFHPFDNASSGRVGFFRYSLSSSQEDLTFGGKCSTYDDWRELDSISRMFVLSQWGSAAAPCAGLLAWLIHLVETTCHQSLLLYLMTSLLFLAATLLQGCTFFIFSEEGFCFQTELDTDCSLGIGGYYSAVATVGYLFILQLYCAMPSSSPCLNKPDDDDNDDDDDKLKNMNNSEGAKGDASPVSNDGVGNSTNAITHSENDDENASSDDNIERNDVDVPAAEGPADIESDSRGNSATGIEAQDDDSLDDTKSAKSAAGATSESTLMVDIHSEDTDQVNSYAVPVDSEEAQTVDDSQLAPMNNDDQSINNDNAVADANAESNTESSVDNRKERCTPSSNGDDTISV